MEADKVEAGIVQREALSYPVFAVGDGLSSTTSLVEQVKANLTRILGTRCTTPGQVGEVPWDPDFGSALHLLKHRNIDDPTTAELARYYVTTKIAKYEPRVRVLAVEVGRGSVWTMLVIRVHYRLIDVHRPGVALATGESLMVEV